MKKKPTIALIAGGTGGHLFPAIALQEELGESAAETTLITDKRGSRFLGPQAQHQVIDVYIRPGIIGKITACLQILVGVVKTIYMLARKRPALVVGFGGYPAFAPLLAAKIMRLPIILFEPNSFFGKVNKFFASDAKLIGLAFADTSSLPKSITAQTIITGDLIRRSIKSFKRNAPKTNNTLRILIFGGSQGASIFSEIAPAAISKLSKNLPNLKLEVIQQARKAEQAKIMELYEKLNIPHEVAEFFHHMPEIYAKTDIAICRAGASTIAELTLAKIPAIYIPLPSAADDHQYFNAQAIANAGGSWCLRQPEADSSKIAEILHEAATNKTILPKMQEHLGHRKTDGARILATACLKLIT